MKKTILLLMTMFSLVMITSNIQAQNAWINELHYDNVSTDAGEFVEVVIENAGIYTLSDFTVTFYNGNNDASYGSVTVDNYTITSIDGDYSFFYIPYSGIQNGAPDGLALSYQSTLISGQFLSYEGTFTAADGPASGITSTDIGVSEDYTTPIGYSLQLSGTGTQYGNFIWLAPDVETPGTLNNGQAFGAGSTPTKLVVISINGGSPPYVNTAFDVEVQAQDDSNSPQNVSSDVNVTLSLATGTGVLGGTITGIISAGSSSVTISGIMYDVAETGVSITATDDAAGLTAGTSDPFEVLAVFTVIEKAYCTSFDALDVFYSQPLSSVDPFDYQLTGTATITFSSAVIDGTDPTIVHLSGVSSNMIGDITLDNIYDDGYGTGYDFYAGIMPISYTNTNNPGGTMSDDIYATFFGIVSANDGYNNVWVSDAIGAYNGILVFDYDFDALVAVEDEIMFSGTRTVYNNLSEIKNATFINLSSSGNTPYGPAVIDGSDIDETLLADTDPGESWEGQLVKIENFTVESYDAANYNYRCSWSDGGPTYYFHIGDNVDYQFGSISLTVGSTYLSITGVVDWDYTNLFYRVNPRTQADVQATATNPPTQLVILSVNNGANPYVDTDFNVHVQTQDGSGVPALATTDVIFNFITNNPGSVDFTPTSTLQGTILTGTSEVIVTGVQMAPAGTGVTITATDNNPFGLLSGVSSSFDVDELILPDLIITEIMQNPDFVYDDFGEWFEVYNNSGSDVDMLGYVIADDDGNNHVIASSLIVPANGFAVLGIDADPASNGGYICDYEYSDFFLANGADEVVIYLPDGITEVDRVNYDGGAVWPDPHGASMSFTGFPSDDNNDGALWTWSVFRESSFSIDPNDKGSPGSNGYSQIFDGGFKLDLTLFLEGAFNPANDSMINGLRAAGVMPFDQPFNPGLPYYGNSTPEWLYGGTEDLVHVQYYAIDWLLIELRDASSAAGATPGTMVAQYPAFVMDDGTVVSMNGTHALNINQAFTNDMYVVVWQRNHLSIMNPTGLTPVEGTTVSYDFSSGEGQVYGDAAGHKMLKAGIWGMISGDSNGNQVINGTDKTEAWNTEAGEAGYKGYDLNLDGEVNNIDKNDFWVPNETASSQVPN